jgi:hypothetical protein
MAIVFLFKKVTLEHKCVNTLNARYKTQRLQLLIRRVDLFFHIFSVLQAFLAVAKKSVVLFLSVCFLKYYNIF